MVVDVLDNASNPSQAVQNVQKFISDSKYVGIFGSGNAAAAVATGAIASQARMPFIALSPPTTLVEPPQPYAYILTATARLYAYNEAAYLKSLGIKRVWLMGDNGGYGRDGPSQVSKLAKQVRPRDSGHDDLLAGFDGLLGRADADQELQRSGSLALDGDARRGDDRQAVQAAATAAAARAHRRKRLAAVPPGHMRRRERRDRQLVPRAPLGRSCRRRTRFAPRLRFSEASSNVPSRTSTAMRPARFGRTRRRSSGAARPARDQQRARDEAPRARDTRRAGSSSRERTTRASSSTRCGPGKIQNCQVRPLFGPAFTKKK